MSSSPSTGSQAYSPTANFYLPTCGTLLLRAAQNGDLGGETMAAQVKLMEFGNGEIVIGDAACLTMKEVIFTRPMKDMEVSSCRHIGGKRSNFPLSKTLTVSVRMRGMLHLMAKVTVVNLEGRLLQVSSGNWKANLHFRCRWNRSDLVSG